MSDYPTPPPISDLHHDNQSQPANSETAAPTARLQIVDENKEFSSQLDSYMKNKWGLTDKGFDYNVVAVFGSQSTGKSTLLNRLFRTDFQVMNEDSRSQTTKGIWLSQAKGHNTLVMDVEGTDGRERGEDQDFERKSSLFAISIAEVIIVNLWESMVGLYHGANMGLLKTVLEVNLQLFQRQGSPKTLLFFVIRDHIGTTSLESLSKILQADLEKIWSSLSKPKDHENSKISEYFDFQFSALPHKVLQPEKFESEAERLRERFTVTAHPQFVFQERYRKGIPADGFPKFAHDIWSTILSNRDLDLPSQQELLAQFRCDEISATAFSKFVEEAKPTKQPIDAGNVVEDLGTTLQSLRDNYVAKFDQQASRYHRDVYNRKRTDLQSKMHTFLNVYFVEQIQNLHKKCLTKLKSELETKLKATDADFHSVVESVVTDVKSYFTRVANDSKLSGTDWSYEESFKTFVDEVDDVVAKKREEELHKMIKALEKYIKSNLSEPVTMLLGEAKPDMWKKLGKAFTEVVEAVSAEFIKKAQAFNMTPEEKQHHLTSLKAQCLTHLKSKVTEQTSDTMLLSKLRHRFEEAFKYDSKGIPRVWKPEDDIDKYYEEAKTSAEKLFTLFSKIELDVSELKLDDLKNSESHSQLVDEFLGTSLLPASKLADLQTRFKRETDTIYIEAKRSVVSTTAKIPQWVIIVLIILGWNEAMTILTNPMYFFGFFLAAGGGYLLWVTGMWGPVSIVLGRVATEVGKQAGDKIRELTESQRAARNPYLRANGTATVSGSSSQGNSSAQNQDIEMKKRD
ncbi:RHD3/Sey1 [Paraphysoderma sedebokerense]|nr:RHD3/Sey1 [Paraphysoderma sedebokerense]